MSKSQLDQLLDESSKIVKRNIPDPQIRLDFESKIYSEGLKADLLLVKKYVPENRRLKMLDIGCGKGHISVLLSNMGFSVCGIDVEQTKGEQLGIRERKWQEHIWEEFENKYAFYGLKYRFYDGKKIPFQNESFDAVVAYAVIEHVDDPVEFLREANRVLKKGGYLFIFRCPRKQAIMEYTARFLKLGHHEKLIAEKELVKMLKRSDFQIMKMTKSDLIPAFPPPKLQNLWNSCFKILHLSDRILLKTPIKYVSHHINVVCYKKLPSESLVS